MVGSCPPTSPSLRPLPPRRTRCWRCRLRRVKRALWASWPCRSTAVPRGISRPPRYRWGSNRSPAVPRRRIHPNLRAVPNTRSPRRPFPHRSPSSRRTRGSGPPGFDCPDRCRTSRPRMGGIPPSCKLIITTELKSGFSGHLITLPSLSQKPEICCRPAPWNVRSILMRASGQGGNAASPTRRGATRLGLRKQART